jgi:predicted O-methyltransferase YrrM
MVYEIDPSADVTHHAYQLAVLTLNAKHVVELGTGQGWSLKYFLDALKITDGRITSIDLRPEAPDVSPTLERYKNEPKVTFMKGDSVEIGRNWNQGPVDIVLCDSNHSKEHVLNELNVWSQYSPKIMFVHDLYLPTGELAEPYFACEEFARVTGKKFVILFNKHPGQGAILF